MSRVPRIDLDRQICSDFEAAASREWLVTNGLGSYAAGTVSGAATRRYHGLLVAALVPPLRRVVLVAGLEIVARYRGQDYPLTSHEYGGGVVHPAGHRHVEAFYLNGGLPNWTFAFADVRLVQSVWMAREADISYVHWRVERASAPVELAVRPLCAGRDFHALNRGERPVALTEVAGGVELTGLSEGRPLRLVCTGGRFVSQPAMYWNFHLRVEAGRGLDATEDLYVPGSFHLPLDSHGSTTLVLSATVTAALPPATALAADRQHRATVLGPRQWEPGWIRQLSLAADQFLVRRATAGANGVTLLAGYPWFGDWGRDTMIALPGIALAGRSREQAAAGPAATILRSWARHLRDGLLPNRFPEAGDDAEYNTADATLWFFQALHACWQATGDDALLRELWPVLTDSIACHLRGTRHGIGVDPADGLLRAGEPGLQLTWMDARVNNEVITPRIGKPVEINALWHSALCRMGDFAAHLGETTLAREYHGLAGRVAAGFRQRFWCDSAGHLYDVVDGPDGPPDDASLRPNQIFAVSLEESLLAPAMARAVVDACQRELLTPMGLRTLAPADPRYRGTCVGSPAERDAAYHQGTVWPWLLGSFALAHWRVYGDQASARLLLAGIGSHLAEACVGTVSEIFDGDAPHRPRGCFAQAWSVAEVLRAWYALKPNTQ